MVSRFVVAAPASGQGKTTLTTGIIAALTAAGHEVAGFKVGPDFIDPGYHALASGRPGRNLDPFLCGEERVATLLLHGSTGARVSVIEGVMGLFDGQLGTDGFASTAHVAQLTAAPVILTVDVSHASRTIGAVVRGLLSFDDTVHVAGLILNKVASPRHRDEVLRALEGCGAPVVGILPRDKAISAPSRHLGLVPVAERADAAAAVARLAAQVAEHIDLARLLEIADAAAPLHGEAWDPAREVTPPSARRPVVAVAGGRAFTFRYPETVQLLRAAGCETVEFDPTTDQDLPPGTAGLYLGGGFPEVHAADLAANQPLRDTLAAAIAAGLPTYAECAGMLYLAESVDGTPMVGALPVEAVMGPRLTLGYRKAVAATDSFLAAAGEELRGHEFHRTTTQTHRPLERAWRWTTHDGHEVSDGFVTGPAVHASYLHTHWAGHPELAQRFAEAVHAFAPTTPAPRGSEAASPLTVDEVAPPTDFDLDHHGDAEVTDGVLDLAVNVRLAEPPAWLAAEIFASPLGAYPKPAAAITALAQWHRVLPGQVLPVAGVAEAFGLIARGLGVTRPAVLHPQFTEPEAALVAAGHTVTRVVGFELADVVVPDDCDLLVVGNPTNPTGVLHRAAELRRLARPGRVLVVDEAFMDAVPGESESLLDGDLAGIVVLRSLTKTWGLAGLRVGYAVGDPTLIAAMAAVQTPWSVSTPALDAIVATCTRRASEEVAAWWPGLVADRAFLVAGLRELGLHVAGTPRTPFVLVKGPIGLRDRLRHAGFGVRRGDTFPGLDATWFRVRVPDQSTSTALLAAMRENLHP